MEIKINTTPEQDAALAALNTQSNLGAEPPLEEFALSLVLGYVDSLAPALKKADVSKQVSILVAVADKLSDADVATLKSIASKFPDADAAVSVLP